MRQAHTRAKKPSTKTRATAGTPQRSHESRPAARQARAKQPPGHDKILRFRGSERMLHWAIAGPFVICYLTALVLVVFYNPHPQRPYRELVSWIHRISGCCLAILPPLVLARNRKDFRIHWYNIRQGWIWTWQDLKWLFLMVPAAISKRITLPEQGKFNAAEKLNFMMVMGTYPLYIVSGVLIWLPGVAFAAWVLHVSMAALATPLILGHIFMATINPASRVGLPGMISGWVDRQWAKHHYRAWYREHFEPRRLEQDTAAPVVARPPAPPSTLARVRCSRCRNERAVASWSLLFESAFAKEPPTCPHCGVDSAVSWVISEPHTLDWVLRQLERAGSQRPAIPVHEPGARSASAAQTGPSSTWGSPAPSSSSSQKSAIGSGKP